MDPDSLPLCIDQRSSEWVNHERSLKKSCHLLKKATPSIPVRSSRFLKMSEMSMIYHEFITYNSGLGNRYPICDIGTIKRCPWCFMRGSDCYLGEPHFLFTCGSINEERASSLVAVFTSSCPALNEELLYKDFWTGRVGDEEMLRRLKAAWELKCVFLERMMCVLAGLLQVILFLFVLYIILYYY